MTRYDVREQHGKYCVVNVDTGEIANVDEKWLEGMTIGDADHAAELLNDAASRRSTVRGE